ncbi:hypothetical protein ACJX0J_041309, partial [Zea mays]
MSMKKIFILLLALTNIISHAYCESYSSSSKLVVVIIFEGALVNAATDSEFFSLNFMFGFSGSFNSLLDVFHLHKTPISSCNFYHIHVRQYYITSIRCNLIIVWFSINYRR